MKTRSYLKAAWRAAVSVALAGIACPLQGQTPGTLDLGFLTGTGPDGGVAEILLQEDGKILIGGYFDTVHGVSRTSLARLNNDGSLDSTFMNGLAGTDISGWVKALAPLPGGKLLVGGLFETFNGSAQANLARLNSNGTLDNSVPMSANGEVLDFAVQSDGKVLVGGSFDVINGVSRAALARLNTNGTLDTGFPSILPQFSSVTRVGVQSDGQIIIAGFFQTQGSPSRSGMARLNPNGTLDATFDAQFPFSQDIRALAIQSDGKILIAGVFNSIQGTYRGNLARLNANGSLDNTFQNLMAGVYDTQGNFAWIETLAVQENGLVLVGGRFDGINGEFRNGLARLNPDGSLDTSFDIGTGVGPQDPVFAFALQPDSRAIVGGGFTSYNGTSRNYLARINAGTLQYPICDEIPLPPGRLKAQLAPANPVECDPPGGALWDPVNQMLLPRTNGSLILTWNFTNGPVVAAVAVQGLPVLAYDLGQQVPPPACATTNLEPITAHGTYWHKRDQRLYVTAPGQTTILWRRPNGPDFTFPQQVVGNWPANSAFYQVHVANTPPVDLAAGGYDYATLLTTESGGSVANRTFQAVAGGRSLLLLSPGFNPDATNIYFQFVQTVLWNNPGHFRDTNVAIIGEPITPPGHNPNAGAPWVFDYLTPSYPWRFCTNFYNRATRTGQVIPVNRSSTGRRDDDLLLVNYEAGLKVRDPRSGGFVNSSVYWPYQPVRYLSIWPANAEALFIAGGQGSGPVMLPDNYWQVYRQPNKNAYGYNPNEEHAFRFGAPPPGLRLNVSATAVSMMPGDSVLLTVWLSGDAAFAPQSPVTVSISDARDGDTNLFVRFPTNAVDGQLVFSVADWSTAQAVTIIANTNLAAGTNVFTLRAGGGLSAQTTVTAFKPDPALPAIVADALVFDLIEGASRGVKLRLSQAPPAPVTLVITNRGASEDSQRLKVQSGGTLNFTTANWFVPQTVTIQGEADPDSGHDSAVMRVTASGGFAGLLELRVTQTDTTPANEAVFALRNDLGDAFAQETPVTSEPYVLVAYTNASGQGRMKVYKVLAEDATHRFESSLKAGQLIQAPYPLVALPECPNTVAVSGPYFLDRNHDYWARAAAIVNGLPAPTNIVVRYFYRPFATAADNGFDPPPGTAPYTGVECLPWQDRYAQTPGTPINYNFIITWPDPLPELRIGETLIKPKFGLPNIANQCSVEVIYEQTGPGTLVQLFDPLAVRVFPVNNLPGNRLPSSIATQVDPADQKLVLMEAPVTVRKRLKFNPNTVPPRFELGGYFNDTDYVGDPLLLPNAMTEADANALKDLSTDTAYRSAIDGLRAATLAAISGVSSMGSQFKALSASFAGGQGYVTLAMQNGAECAPLPISLEIIKVTCPLYRGDIKPIYADCAFDEALTLRHSADFSGLGDAYEYEWFYRKSGDLVWIHDPTQTNQDLTIRGPGLRTLEDYQYYCHYRPKAGGVCGTAWSADTNPALAEGWIKRVLRGINPFNQVNTDYHSGGVNTTANMIQQAGRRWEGNIALNCLPGNNFGLIEAYETVFRRGVDLSIGAGLPLATDTALRLAAGQLSDLYMLLGNEAYADAQDPTVGFGTEGGQYTATSVHCLQGQTTSLLAEELALLRGRDGPFGSLQGPGTRVDISPVYNRVFWNFGPDQAGQTAYVLNYGITDQDGSGTVNATDAQRMFPQAHGDAWGHYLSAVKSFYRLFSNSNYVWLPEVERVNINGADVEVNYLYERKFAKVAAARARAGAEIVDLTYRSLYEEDPAAQWLGYRDGDTNRAWGVTEWASRAGQAALFDWIAGNTLLPDVDNANPPLSKVDRTTVPELREVAASFIDIQQILDHADQGLNPLGLSKEVVPFGLEPGALTAGQTHFDQIFARALAAMNNAIAVFNHANQPTQLLRRQQDTLLDFQRNVNERLTDFTNRLIEIFGYPYAEDIGGAGAYPAGYVGPDLYHFNYVDVRQLAGVEPPITTATSVALREIVVGPDGSLATLSRNVPFNFSTERMQLVKPAHFTTRQAPGELQRALGDLTQARVRLEQALESYDQLINEIEDRANLIRAQFALNAEEIQVLNLAAATQRSLNSKIRFSRGMELFFRTSAKVATLIADAGAEFLPTSVGFSVDATAPARGAIRLAGAITSEALNSSADVIAEQVADHELAKEESETTSQIEVTAIGQEKELLGQLAELRQLVRQEAVQRYELYSLREAVTQAAGQYLSTLARGYRLLEDRVRFLRETAAQVQAYRYKDMAFRIFRNDALQKYRAQFDLAARYVYLAAKTYDYETGLLQTSTRAGAAFLEEIVKKRAIGTIQDGVPLPGTTGDSGLAASMAAMSQNYATIKANLGINNQISRERLFSLRSGWFRIGGGAANSGVWRETLRRHLVNNIWDIPEFQRFCRPLRPEAANGREPALAILFPSMIVAENNFFGWPAGGGDSGYNASVFSTKILSVGIWLSSYDATANGLVQYPSAWLVPIGQDVVRAAGANDFSYRQWKVFDQKIPVPNNFLAAPPNYSANWIPINFSLNGEFGAVGGQRQYNAIDATTENQSGQLDTSHIQTDSGLVGRSVWNTQWLLIIPGVALLGSDPDEGLERFIAGALVGGQRTGNGVTDIKIYFQTYSYSGF